MSRAAFDYLKVKQILQLLKDKGEMSVIDISRELRWSYTTTRKYIEFMAEEGLIKTNKIVKGRRVVKILVRAK